LFVFFFSDFSKSQKKRSLFFVSKKTFFGLFVVFCAQRKFFSFGSVIAFPFSRRKAGKKEKPTFLFENSENSEKLQIEQLPNQKNSELFFKNRMFSN
jgi:hypothetical protein